MEPAQQDSQNSENGQPQPFWLRCWTRLKNHFDFTLKGSVGPTEVTPKTKPAKLFLIAVTGVVVIGSVIFFFTQIHNIYNYFKKAPPRDPTIEVFLPNPTRESEGAFYQDGAVQKRGFDTAMMAAEDWPNKLNVDFQPMSLEESPEMLLQRMKNLYETNGATFFVMTMSTKVGGILRHFESWHNECVRERRREPVLIATAASAPNLADAANGVLRWYVRSEEESSTLAEYLRWKLSVTRAAVFYITRNPNLANDDYGTRGMEVFRDRFSSLGGVCDEQFRFYVTAATAKTAVGSFLARYKGNNHQDTEDRGVFIVGYGDMVRVTIDELLAQGFKGPIVCASTLTELNCQPKDTSADNRIFTVLPRTSASQAQLQGDDKNVVFFFAKKVLLRVLELTAKDRNSGTFIERWKSFSGETQLDQECLANGDIIVRLDVVVAEQWRYQP